MISYKGIYNNETIVTVLSVTHTNENHKMSIQLAFNLLNKVKGNGTKWTRSRSNLKRILVTLERLRTDRANCGGCLFILFKETGLLKDNIRVYFGRYHKSKNKFRLLVSQMLDEILLK